MNLPCPPRRWRDRWSAQALTAASGIALCIALALGLLSTPAAAQSVTELQRRIDESRNRLEAIRTERARLQSELESAQTGAADLSAELRNVERRLSASRSVLAEVELQADAVDAQVDATSTDLLKTREALQVANATLTRRTRTIYKQGPLHAVRVLLSAGSFADLLTRARYMERVAAWDRSLVDQVEVLAEALTDQDTALRERLAELQRLRGVRSSEVSRLGAVERERQRALDQIRRQERQARTRLEQLEADEARLTGLVDDLEARRIELERAMAASGAPVAPSTLTNADAGGLDWPTEGELLYRFGLERRPNGTVLRWNGVGIAAEPGTPVRAVRDGVVVLAGPFEGYGPTVVLSHGNGFYTLYLYLQSIDAVQGRTVRTGEQLGTVGGADTPEGPHIEFQIRTPSDAGSPAARDPLDWLRPRGR